MGRINKLLLLLVRILQEISHVSPMGIAAIALLVALVLAFKI
ncbi:hypothetical protein [Pokkaliibacter plantistimulans]|nr:hypothetical protein [Pokkaliibacter plantistimulans]